MKGRNIYSSAQFDFKSDLAAAHGQSACNCFGNWVNTEYSGYSVMNSPIKKSSNYSQEDSKGLALQSSTSLRLKTSIKQIKNSGSPTKPSVTSNGFALLKQRKDSDEDRGTDPRFLSMKQSPQQVSTNKFYPAPQFQGNSLIPSLGSFQNQSLFSPRTRPNFSEMALATAYTPIRHPVLQPELGYSKKPNMQHQRVATGNINNNFLSVYPVLQDSDDKDLLSIKISSTEEIDKKTSTSDRNALMVDQEKAEEAMLNHFKTLTNTLKGSAKSFRDFNIRRADSIKSSEPSVVESIILSRKDPNGGFLNSLVERSYQEDEGTDKTN